MQDGLQIVSDIHGQSILVVKAQTCGEPEAFIARSLDFDTTGCARLFYTVTGLHFHDSLTVDSDNVHEPAVLNWTQFCFSFPDNFLYINSFPVVNVQRSL
jgi:hypothetical protein